MTMQWIAMATFKWPIFLWQLQNLSYTKLKLGISTPSMDIVRGCFVFIISRLFTFVRILCFPIPLTPFRCYALAWPRLPSLRRRGRMWAVEGR